jgi:hypothetical protein
MFKSDVLQLRDGSTIEATAAVILRQLHLLQKTRPTAFRQTVARYRGHALWQDDTHSQAATQMSLLKFGLPIETVRRVIAAAVTGSIDALEIRSPLSSGNLEFAEPNAVAITGTVICAFKAGEYGEWAHVRIGTVREVAGVGNDGHCVIGKDVQVFVPPGDEFIVAGCPCNGHVVRICNDLYAFFR